MKSYLRFLPVLFLLLLFPLMLSCSEDDSDDESKQLTAAQWVEKGKGFLSDHDAFHAYGAFESALALEPENVDAKYGIVLCGPMFLTNFVDQVINTISAITFQPNSDSKPPNFTYSTDEDEVERVNPIHDYLWDYIGQYTKMAEYYYAELEQVPELEFEIEQYPLFFGDFELFNLSGKLDKTDLHFVAATNAVVSGILNFLFGLDLNYDYEKLAIPSFGGDSTEETLDMIVTLLDNLINSENFPTFLRLDEYNGMLNMPRAGVDLGNACSRFLTALESLEDQPVTRKSRGLWYSDADGDGQFTLGIDPVLIGTSLAIPGNLVEMLEPLALKASYAFYEGSYKDVDPTSIQVLSADAFNEIFASYDILPIELGPITIYELPAWLGINIGDFFSNPKPQGLQSLVKLVVEVLGLVQELLNSEADVAEYQSIYWDEI